MDCRVIKLVNKIKSNFLLKRFIKSVNECEVISDLNDISNFQYSHFISDDEVIIQKFDNIKDYICRKNVITEINNILTKYYRWYKIDDKFFIKLTPQLLLSAWLIYFCPQIIIGDIDSTEKSLCYTYSEKLIIYLTKLTKLNNTNTEEKYNIIDFNKLLLSYTNCITLFLEKDKIEKINHYTAEWISLDKSYDLINISNKYDIEQKKLILNNILKDKQLIEKNIRLFMKNFDFLRLKKIINISNDISKKIIENYKLIIQKDILENKYDISSKILEDIKKFIIIFNRKDEQKINEINERIDSHYFSELLKNNIIKIEDIKIFGDYLIQKICDIGSVECETTNIKKWINIKNSYCNNDRISLLISELFIFSLELIDIIRNELLDYDFLLKNIYN